MMFSRGKDFTANTFNQLYQNYLSFHTADAASPYSAVFWSQPQYSTGHSTFNPTNSLTFGTQTCFSNFGIYEQGLGQYLNWIHLSETNFEDQSSMKKYEICEINKRRPSVIQSIGQVPPLNETVSEIPLTHVSSLPLHSLNVSHGKLKNKESDTKAAMPKEKQLSDFKSLVCNDKNVSDFSQQGNTDRCMRQWTRKISDFEPTEERKYRFHCRFCNKPYHWRSHWKAHERIHTGERPFKCDICGKAFTRSDGLQCHQHTHFRKRGSTVSLSKNEGNEETNNSSKDGSVNSSCDNSSVQAKSTDGVKEYMKNRLDMNVVSSKSKKVLHCHLCKKSFFSSNGLQHHLRQHTTKSKIWLSKTPTKL